MEKFITLEVEGLICISSCTCLWDYVKEVGSTTDVFLEFTNILWSFKERGGGRYNDGVVCIYAQDMNGELWRKVKMQMSRLKWKNGSEKKIKYKEKVRITEDEALLVIQNCCWMKKQHQNSMNLE